MKSNFFRWIKDWKNQKNYVSWLWQYTKPYLPRIIFAMGVDMSTTVITMIMAVLSKDIIDKATNGGGIKAAIVLYILFSLAILGLGFVSQLVSLIVDEKFSFGIRKQVYEKIINSYWMDIKKYHTGDLMTRLTSDAQSIADGIIYTLPMIVRLIFELVLAFFTLFYYQPLLAVFALFMGPVAAGISFIFGKKLKRLTLKVQESESRYRSFMQESLANLLVVKSFGNEEYTTDRLVKLRDERYNWIYKRGKLSILSQSSMGFMFNLAYLVAFAFGAVSLSVGTITYGVMSLFLTLINRVQAPIVGLAQQIPKIVSIFASAERVIELEKIKSEVKEKTTIDTAQVGVRVNNLTFGYDSEKDKVIENVSLDIKPGEFVALIGESGIGKTTLIRLIMSFISNYDGNVSFYNAAGESTPANAGTREWLSYVPQGNTLFSGTIRENITMGKLDATDDEIIDALKHSAAYDFVMELPNGIDTVIGERGHGISEGQAQRIAIARCLIRKAPFMIFDEATSSLDSQTEIEVLQGLAAITPKPTCIIITHRLSVLPYCDRQICIKDKKLGDV